MKKHKICKILLVILAILLCVAFYELLGICIAYKKQPEVSNTTKKETKNGSWNECSENTERAVIIEKNPEALLQRVRLIQNAKEEIILSTFAFKSDESGKLILGALHDAADRGVHIRLLVDGMESWIDMDKRSCPRIMTLTISLHHITMIPFFFHILIRIIRIIKCFIN